MSIKNTNRVFLLMMIGPVLFAGLLGVFIKEATASTIKTIIVYLIMLAFALLWMKKDGVKPSEVMPFRNFPLGQKLLIVIIAGYFLMYVSAFFAGIEELIFHDMLEQQLKLAGVLEGSAGLAIFTTAFIPAFFEELFCRGILFSGYKKGRGTIFGIVVSGILFGMMHGTVTQVGYAAILGILYAVFREVTGSLWPTMIFHLMNNGFATINYLYKDGTVLRHYILSGQVNFTSPLRVVISILLLIVSLAVLYFLVKRLMKLENYDMANMKKQGTGERFITPALVIAMIFVIGAMIVSSFLPELLPILHQH